MPCRRLRDEIDGLLPSHRAPCGAVADHRLAHAVGRLVEAEGVAALRTEWPLLTGASIAGLICTMRSPRVPTSISQPVPQYGQMVRVHFSNMPWSGTGRSAMAPVGQVSAAGAATHTVAFQQAAAAVRQDAGGVAAVPGVPDELALELVTDSHAAEAGDAPRHVHVDVGVGGVGEMTVALPLPPGMTP